MKDQKGITLIALVITIIVLLILAGVSIAMLTGDNGILTKAGDAGTKSAQAEFEESVKLVIAEIVLNDKTGSDAPKDINDTNMKALMPKIDDNIKNFAVVEDTDTTYWKATGKIGNTECTCYVEKATGKTLAKKPE